MFGQNVNRRCSSAELQTVIGMDSLNLLFGNTLQMTERCDSRVHAYANGKTFDQCRQEARKLSGTLAGEILTQGKVSWSHVLETSGHDEIVFKLTLKYLREAGHDIGSHANPLVTMT